MLGLIVQQIRDDYPNRLGHRIASEDVDAERGDSENHWHGDADENQRRHVDQFNFVFAWVEIPEPIGRCHGLYPSKRSRRWYKTRQSNWQSLPHTLGNLRAFVDRTADGS